MRKLFVLLTASALASGALQSASAEIVDLGADPNEFINIKKINKAGTAEMATELKPSMAGSEEGRTYYDLELELLTLSNNKTLEDAFVCFYDSDAINESLTVDDLCGHADADPADIGLDRPQSAFQIHIKHGSTGVSNVIKERFPDSGHAVNYSALTSTEKEANTFRGEYSAVKARLVKIQFALSHAAKNSDNWKLKVSSAYAFSRGGPSFELEDETSYKVQYFGAIDNQRTEVIYGELYQGETSESKTGLETGTFFANNESDVSIKASEFQLEGTQSFVPFAAGAPGDSNQFALECIADAPGAQSVFVGTSSKRFLVEPNGSNLSPEPEAAGSLTQHNCVLYVGGQVEFGSYNNDVTVSIGPVAETLVSI